MLLQVYFSWSSWVCTFFLMENKNLTEITDLHAFLHASLLHFILRWWTFAIRTEEIWVWITSHWVLSLRRTMQWKSIWHSHWNRKWIDPESSTKMIKHRASNMKYYRMKKNRKTQKCVCNQTEILSAIQSKKAMKAEIECLKKKNVKLSAQITSIRNIMIRWGASPNGRWQFIYIRSTD